MIVFAFRVRTKSIIVAKTNGISMQKNLDFSSGANFNVRKITGEAM